MQLLKGNDANEETMSARPSGDARRLDSRLLFGLVRDYRALPPEDQAAVLFMVAEMRSRVRTST